MLIKIIRLITGYVTCVAKGKFTERLINILNKKGFYYWDILPVKQGIMFSISAKDYKKLRKVAAKTGIRTKIIEKRGIPFFIRKYSGRVGLFAGGVIFIALTMFLSKFIWITTVNGNVDIPTSKILKVLNDEGIYSGVYINSLDTKSIERKIIMDLPEIRWISINITGCKAEVEVKEKHKSPKVIDKSYPCNIKARRDAVIVKTNVTEGTPLTKKGSAVIAGQLLVSGIVENEEKGSYLVHSTAEIYGRTQYKKTYKIPRKKEIQVPTGKEIVRNRGNLLWFSLPLNLNHIHYDSYRSVTKTEYLNINDICLPVSLTQEHILEFENKKVEVKNYKSVLQKKAVLNEVFYFKDKEILQKKCKYYLDSNYCYMDVNYTVEENIAVASKILLE